MTNDMDRRDGDREDGNGTPGATCLDLSRARLDRTTGMIHREIRALLDYWQRLRGDRPVPYRAEVDPRDMRCDARNLFILEDLGGGAFRFRLGGTALARAFGTDLRGLSAREIMQGVARESLAALIEETLAEPGVGYARLLAGGDPAQVWELLLLPLRSDFGATDRVLGALVPVDGGLREVAPGPLRFTIDSMTIHPVQPRRERPAAGFAEPAAPFDGPGQPGLTAIDGGRSDAPEEPAPRGGRGHLRLVRDE